MRKFLAAPAIVLGVVALSGSTAFAHECYNASRSAQGNAGASQSNAWGTVTIEDIFADAVANSEEFGLPPADESDIPAMVADAVARGVPLSYVTHFTSTAASGVEGTAHSSDGKGIDHFFVIYEGDLIDSYLCGAGLGDCIE